MPTGHAWDELAPPPAEECWSWSPRGLEDLAHVRRQFRANITDPSERSRLPRLDEDRIEQCVLALEELMSNGLRHGRPPVEVEVCAAPGGVLILVHDRDTENPPRPTSTRDPSEGGMGLGMVAHVALACGWTTEGDCKTVWSLMPSAAAA
ncbi:ATP-binding protein [Klenkia brasiliensis]|uniref:Histidine kinase-like ATPase domain-containing protein n=1 Tax=Klenkia brasiliensis TaxID=333142 RepID=A0A1G8AAI4_9ACTN|nr:ATP-binding protein [Klenkia brasiliensis]SDH17863.1 Histidine kinase-like ATPase domain-containing protein [Klenkia brasiliensis]